MKEHWIDFQEIFLENQQKIAIELIPKNEENLKERILSLKDCDYDIVNLPHLSPKQDWKITFLSPEEILQIGKILPENKKLILHLRTQDSNNIEEVLERIIFLLAEEVSDILLITWDIYTKNNDLITTWDILKKISGEEVFSPSKIAISADLYLKDWWRFDEKIDFLIKNTKTKIFTQPIFSYETIDEILDKKNTYFPNHKLWNIFWWVTWISNSRQRDYWKDINKVPEDYLPKWKSDESIKDASLSMAAEIYKQLKQKWLSQYIMLMGWKIEDLIKIQEKAENILY